jgi:hypothetical protein
MRNNIGTNNSFIWYSIAFGLFSLVAYQFLGYSYQIIAAVLIFAMIWSKKAEYFPGLIIHLFIGPTLVLYTILMTTFLLALYNYRYWFKVKVGRLFLLTLFPFPFVLWQVISMYNINSNYIENVNVAQYYFGIFPFFYGILISHKLDKPIWTALFSIFILSVIFHFTFIFNSTVRIIFYAIPAIIAFSIHKKKEFKVNTLLKIFSIMIMIFVLITINNNTTLTILGSIVFASVLVYLRNRNRQRIIEILTSKYIILSSILIVFLVIQTTTTVSYSGRLKGAQSLRITNPAELFDRAQIKFFADRGPIWKGVWIDMLSKNNFLPPLSIESYKVKYSARRIKESTLEAHNLYLALLQKYGWLVGISISIAFIIMLLKSAKSLNLLTTDPFIITTASTVFSVGVIGSMFGQFPLMTQFSFMFTGLAGICYFSIFSRYSNAGKGDCKEINNKM